MNKNIFIVIFLFSLFFSVNAFSNSIDYLNNQSSDYFRTFNRNAAVDAADIVHYNPAGSVFMEKGTHLKFDLQYLDKDYGMKYNGVDYHTTEPTYIPSFFLASVKNDWSLYCSLNVLAGGGVLNYEKGLPLLKLIPAAAGNDFKGTSAYGAFTPGAAYRVEDWISISLAARGVYAYKKYESSGSVLEIDAEKKAKGAGAVAGIDFFPVKYVNFAAKFETPVKLVFETETRKTIGSFFPDGEKSREDLPATAGCGINFYPLDGLSIGTSLTVYLNRTGKNEVYDEKGYGNGFDWGFGADYAVNSFVLVGCGFQYAETGGADKADYFAYALDSRCYAAGIKLTPAENLKIGFSSTYINYLDAKGDAGAGMEARFHKRIISFNTGIEYSIK